MNFKPMARKLSKSHAGFTLVELLIVITIIAVLTAIGFPLATKMRESAKRTQCMSQLRQWGVAIGGYTADHDGKIEWEPWPSIGTDPLSYSPYVSYWTGDSEDKSGFEAQLRNRCCPAVEWKKVAGGGNSPVTYAMIQPVGVGAVGISGRQNGKSSAYPMAKINRPSRFMLMIDATGSGYYVSTAAQFQTKVQPITVKGDDCRHNQAVNALFADFSVRTMYWPEINKGTSYWTTF
jgi:prepilin-type N-terminal cleavage/methylation domain-containing protein/prepilin-type processing-associated H-X9-DG protein